MSRGEALKAPETPVAPEAGGSGAPGGDVPGAPRLIVPAKAFNACYLPYLQAPQRTQIFYGGAGSGKSVFLATRCVLDAMCGRNTLIVRQVARTLRASCFAETQKSIARFGISGLRAKTKRF